MTSLLELPASPASVDTTPSFHATPPSLAEHANTGTLATAPASSTRKPLHIVTPLLTANVNGRQIGLKLENLQPSRSFKLRGIGHLCQYHAASGCTRFVCSSAGNAGYAVAWAGRALGIPVTVVVPETTPAFVRNRITALGADVVATGKVWDQANAKALELARQSGCAFIPPFDHPLLWQGHATLVDELFQQCEQAPDAIVLAVGGGGLLLGVLEGLKRVGWHGTRVFAVEPENAASLQPTLRGGKVVELARPHSVASSLCVKRIAPALVAACRQQPVTCLTVSDAEATAACVRLAEDQGLVVEPACGAALAPLYSNHQGLRDCKRIVAIVCGGMVVTLAQLSHWQTARFG